MTPKGGFILQPDSEGILRDRRSSIFYLLHRRSFATLYGLVKKSGLTRRKSLLY